MKQDTLVRASKQFGLSGAPTIRRIPGDYLHQVYKCSSNSRTIALKELRLRPELPNWLERFLRAFAVQRYLSGFCEVSVPMPLMTPSGSPIASWHTEDVSGCKAAFTAEEWINGRSLRPDRDISFFFVLCRFIAGVAELPVSLLGSNLTGADDPVPTLDEITRLALSSGIEVPEVLASLEADRVCNSILEGPPATASVVAHRDLAPRNLMVDGDGHLVVLDWENVGLGTLEEELGRAYVEWVLACSKRRRTGVARQLVSLAHSPIREVCNSWFHGWLSGHLMYTGFLLRSRGDLVRDVSASAQLVRLADFITLSLV